MKKFLTLIPTLACLWAQAARQTPVSGRVIDEQGAPIEYATVVLLQDDRQVAGRTTDAEGGFTLKAAEGEYTLTIQYLGYEPLSLQIRIETGAALGAFTLRQTATKIEEVVVEAQLIRREADRFVVDVANSPTAVGKDGVELLTYSPGVWVSDDKISINGSSGAKVYVNGRELHMKSEQLLTYLRSLRTEDIQKIEVVPQTGADFDADSSGGIILITLRRQREDGVMGTMSFYTRHSGYGHDYSPNASINYHKNRLDLYASGWGWLSNDKLCSTERTRYSATASTLDARSYMKHRQRNGGGKLGGVYEFDGRHSLGGQIEYFRDDEPLLTDSRSNMETDGAATVSDSRYDGGTVRNQYSATLNYIFKLDTMGSTFKVLADYTHRNEEDANDMRTLTAAPAGERDSVYRNRTASRYDIAALTLALEKNFSQKWQLKAGAKYTRNDMYNNAVHEYMKQKAWQLDVPHSLLLDYSENIGALYGAVTAHLGRWSLVAGLRGEYTATRGKGNGVRQDYLSLFPNANLSWMLRQDGSHMLIAQYSRTISRPSFWALTPNRLQLSDYTYQTGNPNLDPSYTDDCSLTYVLKQKYTFTAGVKLQHDGIQQMTVQDPDDPNMLIISQYNLKTIDSWYLTANLPIQLAKWWTLNANVIYLYLGMTVPPATEIAYHNFFQGNASTTFTLPCKFMIDVDYFGMSKFYMGNTVINPQHRLSLSLKKRLFGDRLTVTASVANLFVQKQTVTIEADGLTRRVEIRQHWNTRMYGLRIAYNFKAGKAFRSRSVESGAGDEKGRL